MLNLECSEDRLTGMAEYWTHTLEEEKAGYATTATDGVFRLDMHECPSKGFLLRNGLKQYEDYCDHCIGWIGPMMKIAGFQVHHEHNHCGQCWWEFQRSENEKRPSTSAALAGEKDVRIAPNWAPSNKQVDVFRGAFDAKDKIKSDHQIA